MMQPRRKYSASDGYRYGFNGKENDNEVKGEGNQQDYGMRIYDPRLGRFLSVDPITSEYPELAAYQFASNRPIDGVDLDGAETLTLPRIGPLSIPEPVITLPRMPVAPLPPLPPPVMPQAPTIPYSPAMPQAPVIPQFPLNPSITRSTPIDESKIDPNDASTYPKPPFEGNWRVEPIKPGTKGYDKLKDKGATRLENEKGDILRWHKSDKYHPKGHWDFKRGGNPTNPWENYTPDGTKIPEGKIYGKDFNPITFDNPFSIENTIKLVEEYYKKQNYQEKLKQYQRDLKKYEKEMKKYKKALKDYYDKEGERQIESWRNPPIV